ncbi:MAG: ABC transporter ATP-binding protein [Polyangiaceae bacterium]|nr:ABC transporter ATP-binding protein [Polyangiaceae bacterium]
MAVVERVLVEGVTRMFGATAALRGASVTFEAGSLVFLEGPNGAGKSTLLAVVGTLLRPTRGRVRYEPLGEDVRAARAEIGWVAHDAFCYRELSGRENVELAARLYGVGGPGAWDSVVDRVGARRFGDRVFGTLSRGQRQRISLARALVHRPSVLLLDEPFTGLDPESSARFEQVLREESARGALVVVVNHAPALAERLGARVVRLENGCVV